MQRQPGAKQEQLNFFFFLYKNSLMFCVLGNRFLYGAHVGLSNLPSSCLHLSSAKIMACAFLLCKAALQRTKCVLLSHDDLICLCESGLHRYSEMPEVTNISKRKG